MGGFNYFTGSGTNPTSQTDCPPGSTYNANGKQGPGCYATSTGPAAGATPAAGSNGITLPACPSNQTSTSSGCVDRCPQGQTWNQDQQTCISRSGSVSGDPTAPCPPGETREASSAICRCPDGQCRDVVSLGCRGFNPNNEKVNETDDINRATGGGRGYCRGLDPGTAGGGGGAGGGGTGGAGGSSGVNVGAGSNNLLHLFDSQSGSIWDNLTPVMNGSQTTYSPEVIAAMDSKAKLDATGQAAAGRDAILNDSIRRGLGRSGIPTRGIEGVQRQAVESFTAATNANQVEKAKADFADKMAALDAAEKWLAQQQQYAATLDQTAAGREKAAADIALGYARIAADRQMLQSQLSTQLQIAGGNNANQLQIAQLLNLGKILTP